MFNVLLANFNIQIDNRFPFVERQCKDYITDGGAPDMRVRVSEQDIKREHEASVELYGKDHPFSEGYLESICIYRSICEELPEHNAFMLHAAIVELDGRGYAFSARPGVGKSTHASLWREHLGASIVNGDKPIITFEGDRAIAWGTPWCGKEGLAENRSVPLDALCFIERSPTNFVEPMSTEEAATRVMTQLLLPSDPSRMLLLMEHADRLLKLTPAYKIVCNISREAAIVCHDGIQKHNVRKDGN